MQRYGLALTCLCLAWTGTAQAAPRPVLGGQPAYARDYHFLADPAERTDAIDGLKYIPLNADGETYLSLSGEGRLRYDDFSKNPGFGISGLHADDYVYTRALLGADLHVGTHFRIFTQLASTTVDGKEGTISQTDESGLDWQQAFVELNLSTDAKTDIVARLGRQEVIFGSQRLVALRDGPNLRQSFDGARLIVKHGPYELTAFAFQPVQLKRDDFDDTADKTQDFYGVYATLPFGRVKGAFLDAYILRLERRNAVFAQGKATERRNSAGIRLWGVRGPLDYNFETLYQFGDFGAQKIRAWTFASDTGYTARDLRWSPRFGLKADIASGDKDSHDNELNTFNALFPKGGYFTENGLIGPSNIADLQPSLTLNLTPTINVMISAVILWRDTSEDAIYRQPNTPIAGTAGMPDRYTGTQYYVTPTWQINSHLLLSATYVHFAVGETIKAVGGGDSDYFSTWLTYRF